MSKGFFRTVLTVAAIAVQFIPGIGQFAGTLISMGLMATAAAIGTKKAKPLSTDATDRLNSTFDVNTPRKIVYGTTALATDIRYQSFTGTNDQFFWQVLCLASHKIDSITEVWLDNERAWTPGGGMATKYAPWTGAMFATGEGTPGGGYAIDGRWTANCSLTGCAQLVMRYKLRGDSDKDQSLWAGGVTSRITIRGKGAPLYDPRLDSTRGGSGPLRADDQTTWIFTDAIGNNPALQLLHFMLGWKIGGKVAVGMGIPPARIDFASFITAANICDEPVTLAVGGTERRYRSAGVVSEADDRTAVISNLCQTMNGFVRDSGGRLSLQLLVNDLAAPVADFTEADIIGEEGWQQTPSTPPANVLRGRWIDPSDAALYAPLDFPEVRLTSFDAIDRIDTLELPFVQSASQAQRIAKTRLQRAQYQGRYTALFGARAWQVSIGSVVRLSHQGLGWSNKLFRVVRWAMDGAGRVQLELLEESAAIYAWLTEETAPVAPATPVVYDPRKSPVLLGLLQALTVQGVGGPRSATLSYDSTGEHIQGGGAISSYYLSGIDGVVTSGTILATYRVLDGKVNGFIAGSGEHAMAVIDGVALLDLTSDAALTTATATVLVGINRDGSVYTAEVALARQLAPMASGGGTGSGSGAAPGPTASQTSGFANTGSGAVSGVLTYTLPAGKTAVTLSTAMQAMPVATAGGLLTNGEWTINGWWERNTGTSASPVWTQVGSTGATGNSSSYWDSSLRQQFRSAADLSGTWSDTGLAAGTYEYRWVQQIDSTNSTNTTRSHTNAGTVSITS